MSFQKLLFIRQSLFSKMHSIFPKHVKFIRVIKYESPYIRSTGTERRKALLHSVPRDHKDSTSAEGEHSGKVLNFRRSFLQHTSVLTDVIVQVVIHTCTLHSTNVGYGSFFYDWSLLYAHSVDHFKNIFKNNYLNIYLH